LGGADGRQLDLTSSVGVAVPLFVRAMEAFGELVPERDRQLEGLAPVAKVRLALRRQVALVPGREAQRRENARRRRHEHRLHPQLLGERAGVKRAGAAVRDERELAWVV